MDEYPDRKKASWLFVDMRLKAGLEGLYGLSQMKIPTFNSDAKKSNTRLC